MDEIASLGYWIRRRRKALDLTREALARRVGCAAVTLVKIEADERRPSLQTAARLAAALQLAAEEQAVFFEVVRGERWAGALTVATRPVAGAPSRPGQSALHARSHNVPRQRNRLIGRERELADVCGLLARDDMGLVTLTGPGGAGKTRLGLQVAAELLGDFADGVWFVDLAPISDPVLVPATIAATLGLTETGGQPLVESLKACLRDKSILLLLDNFEQVAPAAPLITDLLKAAPDLHVLVTSRVVLHLYGEQEYPAPPLALPDPQRLPPLDILTQYAAVTLFIQRARAVKPDFQVTNETAPAVAEICARLDGLPLALELAAARVKLLPPTALLQRLNNRLKVLTGGAHDLPARQQTLRATIDWSYQLLTPSEQALFQRLAIFVGGWTLDAVEAICKGEGEAPLDVLDGMQSLVDKSLVRRLEGVDSDPRFTMLETVREYALEQLEARGETGDVRQRHAAYYLGLAEAAELQLHGAEQHVWLSRLEVEHDNLHAALHMAAEAGSPELGLRLAAALWWFWHIQGYWTDAGRWLNLFLMQREGIRPELQAKVLGPAGRLALDVGDLVRSKLLLEECVALWRQLGDTWKLAKALNDLAWVALHSGDYSRAQSLLEEKLQLCRNLGQQSAVAGTLQHLGLVALEQRDDEQALPLLTESRRLTQALANQRGLAWRLEKLGLVAFYRREDVCSHELFDEALQIFRTLGDQTGIAFLLLRSARVALQQGGASRAQGLLHESLRRFVHLGDKRSIATCLETAAVLTLERGQHERAVHLWGAADALRSVTGLPLSPADQAHDAWYRASAREQLDTGSYVTAWAEGRAMTLEQAIAYALEETSHA